MKLKLVFAIAISFFFIYFVFKDIDLNEIIKSFRYINTSDVILATISISIFYFIRAYRWKVLLDKKVSYSDVFFASSLAYFFSLILLLQAGELSKIHYLKKKYNIDKGLTLSTILIERLLDVSTLVIFFFISLTYYSIDSKNLVNFLGAIGLLMLIFLTFSKYFFSKIRETYLHNKIHDQLFKFKFGRHIIEFYKNLNSAFILMHSNGLKLWIISIFLWFINFLSLFVFLGKHGNFFEILGGFCMLSLGVAAQVTPANIGQYEFIWAEVFNGITTISVEQLIASGIILHLIIIITIVTFALFSWVFVRNN
jgi:glycosyltransferase 2 family protein